MDGILLARPKRAYSFVTSDSTGHRAVTYLLLALLQFITLAPCAAPTAFYVPQLISFTRGAGHVYLVAMTAATTIVLLGVLRVFHRVTVNAPRFTRHIVLALLIALSSCLMGSAAYYSRFAVYPGAGIIWNFIDAPTVFVAYTSSDATAMDLLVFGGATATLIALCAVVTHRVWRERPAGDRAVWNILVGALLLWAFRDAPTQHGAARILIAEHSIPSGKYMYDLARWFGPNHVERVAPYIPRPSTPSASSAIPAARHVVLVIAECLRADRLSPYGYARNTTPFIESELSRWLVFEHAYSHGSSTESSFPVIFNAKYFSGILRRNDGAHAFWGSLREQGIGSAFLSAGAMEWGGITRSVDILAADYHMTASTVGERRDNWLATNRRFEYAVDDSIPLRRLIGLLEGDFAKRPSFAALHLVGSHYPFEYQDSAKDVFFPSLRHMAKAVDPASSSELKRERRDATITEISNSFDNSIIHIDGVVRQLIEALQRLGIADDSVVIVTSDHGDSFGEHQTFFHGSTLYEEQVHVPLLMRVGDHLGEARSLLQQRRADVVGHVDLVPTILHLLSGSPPASKVFDGASWLTSSRKPYELLLYGGIGEKVAVLTDRKKYIFDIPGQSAEEYSIREDPGEHHNLWTGSERSVSQFTEALVKKGVLPSADVRGGQ